MEFAAGRNSGTTRPRFVQTEPENIPDDEGRGIHCLDKYSLMFARGVMWVVDGNSWCCVDRGLLDGCGVFG